MLTRPSALLRIEEATLLLLTLFTYQHLHYSWLLFALLFLTPDFFMLGYLLNARVGALICTAHIAFDGLKYPTYFKDTHLQHVS